MGQMFYDRWRSNNRPTIVKLVRDNKILTNIQIGGRFYPTKITLVDGMSPVRLGLDFFLNYNWKKPEDLQIQTEVGTICLKEDGDLFIDEDTTAKTVQCEEVFLAEPTVEKQVKKLHAYFGHCSPGSLLRILKASSRRDEFDAKTIQRVCEDCKVCRLTTRKVNKKKTALPKATAFNQVISLDLKFHVNSTYVLWACDEATKLLRGEVIQDKTPETMMKALDNIWINGRGMGPGLPERGFFTDNGTEFLNDKFKSLLQAASITLTTTSTYSPQQNGVNERNHGTADILV